MVKLVSVVERERPKECAIVCVVELGGASIRDEDGGNMSDAIIPALKHRIPSELRSKACLGESSTRMGDLLGSPRVAFLL